VTVLCVTGHARADDRPRAREAYREGARRFDVGDHRNALETELDAYGGVGGTTTSVSAGGSAGGTGTNSGGDLGGAAHGGGAYGGGGAGYGDVGGNAPTFATGSIVSPAEGAHGTHHPVTFRIRQ
jgi:hypothetical protein